MAGGEGWALRARACGFAAAPVEQGSNPELPTAKKEKGPTRGPFLFLAGGEGFEPPLAESESAVLPLDDPPNRIA